MLIAEQVYELEIRECQSIRTMKSERTQLVTYFSSKVGDLLIGKLLGTLSNRMKYTLVT